MQYVENAQDIVIRDNEPYTPTSDWFISIERENLENENFGLRFVIASVVYPIYFTLDNEGAQAIPSQQITLSIDIGMLVPFRLETCQAGNYQQFTMQPRIVSGAAHELPVLYGSPGNQISPEIVDEFRLTLLSNTLPGLGQTFTEFTLGAEATAEATGIVEITPESTSEVEGSTQD